MAVSKKQQACVNRYMAAHYDRVNLTVPKGRKSVISDRAKSLGMSANAYINMLIDADLPSNGDNSPSDSI
jgi:hypothetical protein